MDKLNLINTTFAKHKAKKMLENDKINENIRNQMMITQGKEEILKMYKLFREEFDEWYVKYLAGKTDTPYTFTLGNSGASRLDPEFKELLKNEIYTVVNDSLKEKGLRVNYVSHNVLYFCGYYLLINIKIGKIGDFYCNIS